MKKIKIQKKLLSMAIVLSMGITFLSPISAYATTKTWESVGTAGFSSDGAVYTSMAIDKDGTPYVVYEEYYSGKATVMKYDGSNWVIVGNPEFSDGVAQYTSIAIDGSGTPYVAHMRMEVQQQ